MASFSDEEHKYRFCFCCFTMYLFLPIDTSFVFGSIHNYNQSLLRIRLNGILSCLLMCLQCIGLSNLCAVLCCLQEASSRVSSYQSELDASLTRLRKLENRVGELVGREEAMLEEQKNGKWAGEEGRYG